MGTHIFRFFFQHLSTSLFQFLTITLCFLCFPTFTNGQVTLPNGVPSGADLLLWLSPDTAMYHGNGNIANIGQRVDKWHDISGNGFIFDAPAANNRPALDTVDGYQYLDFTTGDFFENVAIRDSINGLTAFSIFIVIKSDVTNSDNGFLDSEDPNGTDDKICLRYDANGANSGRTNLLKSGLGGNVANQQVETQSNTQTTDRQVLTITWSINNRLRVYIDGILNDTSNNTITTALSGINKIIIGKGPKNTATNSGWDGKIGSVLFFKEEFSPDTINNITQTIGTIVSIKSGNWNDPTTWDCTCIPKITQNVEISNGHTVNLTAGAVAKNLIILTGGSLNGGSAANTLSIDGNFTNNGSFDHGNSTISFINSNPQRIIGTNTFFNLTIANSQQVSFESGTTQIHGLLTPNSGMIITNNNLVIASNDLGTGSIGNMNSASITGNVVVQRYIDAGSSNWRNLCSPINNATLSSWSDDFITSGFPGSFDPSFPFISIYSYDESVAGVKSNGYTAPTNITNSIGVGQGFMVFCGDQLTGTQPFTIDVNGTINQGSINLPVDYSFSFSTPSSEIGWNLVGNPYPSTIDWDNGNWTKTRINDAIYIFDPDLNQFSSYVNGSSTNGGSEFIPSSQSFWVKATFLGPQLIVTEDVKASTDAPFFKLKIDKSSINIHLSGNGYSDEAVLNIDQNALNSLDDKRDAYKLYSTHPQIHSLAIVKDTVTNSIASFPPPKKDRIIPLEVKVKHSGTYTFKINPELNSQVSCTKFEDRIEKIIISLDSLLTYSCIITDSTDENRFYIHLGGSIDVKKKELSCINKNDGEIIAVAPSEGEWNYEWKNLKNDTILYSTNNVSDTLKNLKEGIYQLKIGTNGMCGYYSTEVRLNEPPKPNVDFTYEINSAEGLYLIQYQSPLNYKGSVFWDLGDGTTSAIGNPIKEYKAGTYDVSYTNTLDSNCVATSNTQLILEKIIKIKEELPIKELQVFPVPSSTLINFNLMTSGKIMNSQGQFVLEFNNKMKLDISNLATGMYFIHTIDNQYLTFQKIQ